MDNTISGSQIIQQLEQMRRMASAGMSEVAVSSGSVNPGTAFGSVAAGQSAENAGFGEMLQGAIDQVNSVQTQAASSAQAFEAGDKNVELADVMVQMQKARISFEALTQVRNRLLSAYQEIMSMQI